MKVNFNNLRRQAMNAYTRLIETLKENMDARVIRVTPEEIERPLDDLRLILAGIACCYEDGNSLFSDLGEECDKMPFLINEAGRQKDEHKDRMGRRND